MSTPRTTPPTRGGPRPGSGRPRRKEPTTTAEAAVELSRYADGVTDEGGRVVLTLEAATVLTARLRRRKMPARQE